MAFLLSKGADPSIVNLAGDSAIAVGNTFTQTALHLAQSAIAGEVSLDPGIVEEDTAQTPTTPNTEQPQQEESQQPSDGAEETHEETEDRPSTGEGREERDPSVHEEVHESNEAVPADGGVAEVPESGVEDLGSREATPDIEGNVGELTEPPSEADPSAQEPVDVEGPVDAAAADVSAIDA